MDEILWKFKESKGVYVPPGDLALLDLKQKVENLKSSNKGFKYAY